MHKLSRLAHVTNSQILTTESIRFWSRVGPVHAFARTVCSYGGMTFILVYRNKVYNPSPRCNVKLENLWKRIMSCVVLLFKQKYVEDRLIFQVIWCRMFIYWIHYRLILDLWYMCYLKFSYQLGALIVSFVWGFMIYVLFKL